MVKGKEIRKAFGRTLKELRLERNLSQEKLSELADLDRSYVSEIENGNKTASLTTLFKLAAALEVKPSALINQMESYFKFT